MTPDDLEKQEQGPNLTIGALAERTGLTPAVLRTWETRHGFPVPHRLASGHRRYDEQQAELVAQVLRRRDSGIRLDIAIAEAQASAAPAAPSAFAELRRRHPALAPHRLRKSTLLALSWALEDECCARADRPVLFGSFQTADFYRPSIPRWTELARVARSTMVFADFPDLNGTPDADDPGTSAPIRIPLATDAPMRREWSIVCDAADGAACLSAWELPGQHEVPDRHRIFETVWTVDPRAVRDAARACARVAVDNGVAQAAPLLYELSEEPSARWVDPAGTTALFNRIVAYVDRLGR